MSLLKKVQRNYANLTQSDLKELINTPLSCNQISSALESKGHQLRCGKYDEIPEGIGLTTWLNMLPFKSFICLYRWNPKYGHFIALMLRDDGIVEYFDPTGSSGGRSGRPDSLQSLISKEEQKILNQDQQRILDGMRIDNEQGRPLPAYNDKIIQAKNTETCGRQCLLRVLYRDMDEYAYADMLRDTAKKTGLSIDEVVTLATC